MTANVRSSSFYLRKRTRGTILEIRQSLSLESTLTGLRTFLVTEKFLDMICILNSFLSLYCNLGYVILS